MKLKTLEQFEQKDPCECGGNCSCGNGNKINEAKKYKFKDLSKAWAHVYGEDMEDEYPAFYQEVTGKYKNKVTKQDIADIWQKVYGEDMASEYDGFYNDIKENLDEANKLEEFNSLNEAKPDGTISPDEDGLRDKLLLETELAITEFLDALKEKSYGIGGKFRGPGILAENMKIVQDKVKRFK